MDYRTVALRDDPSWRKREWKEYGIWEEAPRIVYYFLDKFRK